MNQENKTKLSNFIDKELSSELKNILFLENSDKGYIIFGKYNIFLDNNYYHIKISGEKQHDDAYFTYSKLAVVWSIFHKFNKIKEQNRILYLDQKLSILKEEIKHLKSKLKKKKNEDQSIFFAKIAEKKHKKLVIEQEIRDIVVLANITQTRQFNNFALNKKKN